MSETSHEARMIEAQAYQEQQKARRKKEKAPLKEEYVLQNKKVLRIVTAPSGAKYSQYVGNAKQCKDLIKKHNLR